MHDLELQTFDIDLDICRAPAVLLEIESRWTERYGYKPEDIFALMAKAGYSYETMTSAGPMQPTSITADLQRGNNFLFTR